MLAATSLGLGAAPAQARLRRQGARKPSVGVSAKATKSKPPGLTVTPDEAHSYVPPSHGPAQTELQRLATFSNIVPDSVIPEKFRSLGVASAAVVSHTKLMNAALSPSREYEAAITGALAYPRCRIPGAGMGVDVSCLVDKAMVNLGADLASLVSGRVSHELDGRLLHDKNKVLQKAKTIVDMYKEMGIPRSRLLIGVECTWEGIEAIKVLENEGIECHVRSVYTLQQAAAAIAAGCAVIQPSVVSIQDYYAKHPNAIPRAGPRSDAGSLNDDPAGAASEVAHNLVAQIIAFMQANKVTKTKTMAAVRTVEDVQALAGVDFLLAPVSVLERLNEIPTLSGYNDGISAVASSMQLDEVPPIFQRANGFKDKVKNVTDGRKMKKEEFLEALNGGPWAEILNTRLRSAESSAARADAHMKKMWPPQGAM